MFLTHYCEYPIYEPAEGGYYYSGLEATEAIEFDTEEEAIQYLAEMKSDLEENGFTVYDTRAVLSSKYIGSSEYWEIEKQYGSLNRGKQIYQ